MKRRTLLKATAAGGTTMALLGSAAWLSVEPGCDSLNIETALAKLRSMTTKTVTSHGKWDPAQIFTHCAQSVEYSMTGFPVHKSDVFKNTAGAIAFAAFAAKGKMRHGLDQPIPGAPALHPDQLTEVALLRLERSMLTFKRYSKPLHPHFAYGDLSKEEYEAAHVLHLYNHLQEMSS